MAEEKDTIGRDEPLNEDASTPETDGAADESPALVLRLIPVS